VDSITHMTLGAVVGEAIAGKSLGKRAMFYGAIAQSIPDIDFIAAFWLSPADNLMAHRGFTHSFLFGVITTMFLALVSARAHRPLKIPTLTWMFLYGAEILIHLLLDACNAYGVGWFEPFSAIRFSFHILFVADPFFSIASGISLVALITLDSKSKFRTYWIAFGLMATAAYFAYAVLNKLSVQRAVTKALQNQQLPYFRLLITPTPANTWLWYVAAESDSGFHVTYQSVFDDPQKPLSFTYFPRQNKWLQPIREQHEVHQLLRFSQGFYTIENRNDTLILNDLRFGQIAGWDEPRAEFVFHYYLNHPEANLMVIQRGRFSNWNKKTFQSLISRIKGNR
jgi:inner membrane protein